MTTETKPAGEPQPQSDNGPWNMSFDKLMQAAGKAVESVKASVTPSTEPSTAPSKKPWEMSFDDLKKYIPGLSPRPVEIAPPSPVKEAPRGAYFAPENDNPSQKKIRGLFNKVIKTESGFRHYNEDNGILTSPKGAEGLTQMMPKTQMNPGFGVEPLKDKSPNEFLRGGFDYLVAMDAKYKGDTRKALAAYNYGPGNVDKAISQARKAGVNWETRLPKETRDYLTKIVGKQ